MLGKLHGHWHGYGIWHGHDGCTALFVGCFALGRLNGLGWLSLQYGQENITALGAA